MPEQKRLAKILDKANEVRRKLQQSLRLSDDFLRSVFLEIFGDPVTNPKGWDKVTIDDLVDNIDSGWSPTCLNRTPLEEEWGVLKLGAVTQCSYRDDQAKALPSNLSPKLDLEVLKGDLLFTRKNTYDLVAACAYVHETRPKLMLSDLIFRLRLSDNRRTNPVFLWQLLIQPGLRKDIQSLASGAAGSMPNISKARLKTFELIHPPQDLQRHFAKIATRIEASKSSLRSYLNDANTLFSSLQQRAFRGEL